MTHEWMTLSIRDYAMNSNLVLSTIDYRDSLIFNTVTYKFDTGTDCDTLELGKYYRFGVAMAIHLHAWLNLNATDFRCAPLNSVSILGSLAFKKSTHARIYGICANKFAFGSLGYSSYDLLRTQWREFDPHFPCYLSMLANYYVSPNNQIWRHNLAFNLNSDLFSVQLFAGFSKISFKRNHFVDLNGRQMLASHLCYDKCWCLPTFSPKKISW